MVKVKKTIMMLFILSFVAFTLSACSQSDDIQDNNVQQEEDVGSVEDFDENQDNNNNVNTGSETDDTTYEESVEDSFIEETEDIEIGSLI